MLSENLDLVRSIYADWERGDFSRADWADPEIEFEAIGGPSQARTHGIPGMAREMRDFLTAWEGYRSEAEEYRELDRERVLVLTLDSARGKQSDVAMEQRRASVYLIRDGKCRGSRPTGTATAPSPTSASPQRTKRGD